MPKGVGDDEVHRALGGYGRIESVRMVESKDICFVDFSKEHELKTLVEAASSEDFAAPVFGGKRVLVEWAGQGPPPLDSEGAQGNARFGTERRRTWSGNTGKGVYGEGNLGKGGRGGRGGRGGGLRGSSTGTYRGTGAGR